MGNILQLFLIAFILTLNIARGGDDSQQVTGLIGQSIPLVIQQNYSHLVKEVVWRFLRGSQRFKIAETKDNISEYYEPQFQNRLEMFSNGTELHIKNASFKDNGTYSATLTLKNNDIIYKSFHVSLYEPVPAPSIKYDEKSTNNRCNVTFYCDVLTSTTHLSYNWKYRFNGSDYQLFNSTNDRIQMFLQSGLEIEVQCIVRNPADSKNVSVTLRPCLEEGSHRNQRHWLIPAVLLLFVVVFGCVITYKQERIRNSACIRNKEKQKKEEELKTGIPETDNILPLPESCSDPKQKEEFFSPKEPVTYGHLNFIPVHGEKREKGITTMEYKDLLQSTISEDEMALGGCERPSNFLALEDSEEGCDNSEL